jgi:formimidoylglutamate deiminase
MNNSLFAHQAWLPDGWQENVRLEWDDSGNLQSVQPNAACLPEDQVAGIVLPGMINLHSHSFQRAMGGLTEKAGDGPDSFWTWRDLMYRFARQITPENMQAIAAQLFAECLRHGYTSICEFHYIHRQPDGAWYPRKAQTAERIIAAAHEAGIGITMLPVLYNWANFGEVPLRDEQCRFSTSVDDILQIMANLEPLRCPQVEIGAAPHSLRAASIEQILALLQDMPTDRPVHMHISEQIKEVNDCLVWSGKRPLELLAENVPINERWCLIHATHLTHDEVQILAESGAVAGLCPTTEANLGDGLFAMPPYVAQGGRFGIGSDSHVSTSPVEEMRWLEYGQRLSFQRRNMVFHAPEKKVADFIWQQALQGGAQASGRSVGALVAGKRADLLVLDSGHPNLFDARSEEILSRWLFCGNDNLVRDVMVGGQWRVQGGRHLQQEAIAENYKTTMRQLRQMELEAGQARATGG